MSGSVAPPRQCYSILKLPRFRGHRIIWVRSTMAKTRRAYPPEFRRQIVELVYGGRTPEELAQEFEPTAQSIRNWVAQFERNEPAAA